MILSASTIYSDLHSSDVTTFVHPCRLVVATWNLLIVLSFSPKSISSTVERPRPASSYMTVRTVAELHALS